MFHYCFSLKLGTGHLLLSSLNGASTSLSFPSTCHCLSLRPSQRVFCHVGVCSDSFQLEFSFLLATAVFSIASQAGSAADSCYTFNTYTLSQFILRPFSSDLEVNTLISLCRCREFLFSIISWSMGWRSTWTTQNCERAVRREGLWGGCALS